MTFIPPPLFIGDKQQTATDPSRIPVAFKQLERYIGGLRIPTGGGGGGYASLTGPGQTTTPGDLTQAGGFTVNDTAGSGINLTESTGIIAITTNGALTGIQVMSTTVTVFAVTSFTVSCNFRTQPPASHTSTAGWAFTYGADNVANLGHDILVNLSIPYTAASGGQFMAGVGPTVGPTVDPVTAALSGSGVVNFSQYVPDGHTLHVNHTGTITPTTGSIVHQVSGV